MASGWECPRCHRVWAPTVQTCTCVPESSLAERLGMPSPLGRTTGFDPSRCPCNPANGGSGICGCVMSGPQITCAAVG